LTGKLRRLSEPGRGDWPMTRPRSDRLDRACRTLPTEQWAARIFCFAIPSRSPSSLGTRQRTGGRLFAFEPTDETGRLGTAVAAADRLQPEREYRYAVLWRSVIVGRGTLRAMPRTGSYADMTFLVASCSDNGDLGVWTMIRDAVRRLKPRFLLLIGDQVYQDDVWDQHGSRSASQREGECYVWAEPMLLGSPFGVGSPAGESPAGPGGEGVQA
jgi:hypothetical protein